MYDRCFNANGRCRFLYPLGVLLIICKWGVRTKPFLLLFVWCVWEDQIPVLIYFCNVVLLDTCGATSLHLVGTGGSLVMPTTVWEFLRFRFVGFGKGKVQKMLWSCAVMVVVWVIWLESNEHILHNRSHGGGVLWNRVIFQLFVVCSFWACPLFTLLTHVYSMAGKHFCNSSLGGYLVLHEECFVLLIKFSFI